ncbi:MAG: class II aldolase/adducin family protein [Firmicutes bacterium]|nr:class II aldolase/adducin family protein [Bacillota bacterium]
MNTLERAKRELVNTAYAAYQKGLFYETWGNMSCKPTENSIVITPSGIPYAKLRFFDMVVIESSGKTLQGRLKPSTELPLHLAIYEKRKDIRAIVHTHSIYAAAFAVSRKGIPVALEEQAQIVGGVVEVAAYAPPGSPELAANALEALGDNSAVLLANHGLICTGPDLAAALQRCIVIERNARVILCSKLLGQTFTLSPEEVTNLRSDFLFLYGQQGHAE